MFFFVSFLAISNTSLTSIIYWSSSTTANNVVSSWTRSLSSISQSFDGKFESNCAKFEYSFTQSLRWLYCKLFKIFIFIVKEIESSLKALSNWTNTNSYVTYFCRSFIRRKKNFSFFCSDADDLEMLLFD